VFYKSYIDLGTQDGIVPSNMQSRRLIRVSRVSRVSRDSRVSWVGRVSRVGKHDARVSRVW
jgi:hypothetical protein